MLARHHSFHRIFFVCSVAIFVCALSEQTTSACSAFLLSSGGNKTVGKNFDWNYDHGLVVVNKRHLIKTALAKSPNVPARWTSKYGSVTFNQVSRELPQGGINEKGLIIEILWLDSASYPAQDERPVINELQWIQYQLDNFSSIREVIANLDRVRRAKSFANIHYFMCDPSEQCATVEPLDGKFVVHTGDTLPVAALTNDNYSDSVHYAEKAAQNAHCANIPIDPSSLNRFSKIACLLKPIANSDQTTPPVNVFSILGEVAQAHHTKWSITYDLTDLEVTFHTDRASANKLIRLRGLDFSCAQPTQILDINRKAGGDATGSFKPYTVKANRKIVELSLATGFAHLPPPVIDLLTRYPDSAVCNFTN